MTLSLDRCRHYLRNFELEKLFTQELGWDRHSAKPQVNIDGHSYQLRALAEKKGLQVFQCGPGADGKIPDRNTRRKLEKQIAKAAYWHLIIYVDRDLAVQQWQAAFRESGQPAKVREYSYDPRRHSGDAIIQKLRSIQFSLEEEEELDHVEVTTRYREGFYRDQVTKNFYERFRAEHEAFLRFIKGIKDQGDREWYASLMLNRLMFVYFIQKKGFLDWKEGTADGDRNYLHNRLRMVQEQEGKGRFLDFYRSFLLALFHEGFAKRPERWNVTPAQRKLIGNVPYLNGGLFDVHELEEKHPHIDIPDEAFERVFHFFDQYDWTLDTRPLRNDKEINPDVLGYIFEKYINQKEMGAYYTKEDITDYIGKNTIIPYLFDAARRECRIAFEPDSPLWRTLRDNPDRYLYAAVRRGVTDDHGDVVPLPAQIQKGIDDFKRRAEWNRPAWPDHPDYALPTETWREYLERRHRCLQVREKLLNGDIHEINDLITYNLDVRQFAEDAITESEGPELLRAFYKSISGITVLDPACGSGAFLFAALNILEPLYDACLDRMQAFVDDLERSGEPHSPKKFGDLRKVIAEIDRHPNPSYFILKSIVVNNLYGVDLMEEAAEICKLRLFLKLVAQVDKVSDLEPLPDIDFNIRAGNTLVGHVTYGDVKAAIGGQQRLAFDDTLQRIEQKARDIERLFGHFREQQTELGGAVTLEDKQQLRSWQKELAEELNQYLADEYKVKKPGYVAWRTAHQPFHWFVEFHGIIADGGFDVVIGNPPWKEYASVRKTYTIRGYTTESCGNLHGIFTERALTLRSSRGRASFIVQLPMVSSSRMVSVRAVLSQRSNSLYIVPFDDRPGKLFEGLEHCRSIIFISNAAQPNSQSVLLATRYQRWPTEVRPVLFTQLHYVETTGATLHRDTFPKYASDLMVAVFRKIRAGSDTTVGNLTRKTRSNSFLFYQEATQYWVKATIGLPFYSKDGVEGAPAHGRYIFFDDREAAAMVCAILHSSLFYLYFIAYSDCFHLSHTLVKGFPIRSTLIKERNLATLGVELQRSLTENAVRKTINTRDGSTIEYAEFYASKSKPIIDRIDFILGKHLGFTEAEFDFVINYDIKYRMGSNDGGEG